MYRCNWVSNVRNKRLQTEITQSNASSIKMIHIWAPQWPNGSLSLTTLPNRNVHSLNPGWGTYVACHTLPSLSFSLHFLSQHYLSNKRQKPEKNFILCCEEELCSVCLRLSSWICWSSVFFMWGSSRGGRVIPQMKIHYLSSLLLLICCLCSLFSAHKWLLWSCVAFHSDSNLCARNKNGMKKEISLQGSIKWRRITDIIVIYDDTHSSQLWVDTKVFPISTAHVSQHTSRWERGQEVANTRPGGVASAAEVGGDGVVHSVNILLLQTGCVGMATGKWGGRWRRGRGYWGSSLTVTGRGEDWREGGEDEINGVNGENKE